MKFGIRYHLVQIPEWADAYQRYDTAKLLIKRLHWAESSLDNGRLLEQLHKLLNDDLETVTTLYASQQSRLQQQLSTLGPDFTSLSLQLSQNGSVVAMKYSEVLALAADLNRLLWYGRVNAEAFSNIFRKMDNLPFVAYTIFKEHKEQFLAAPFVVQTECLSALQSLEGRLQKNPAPLESRPSGQNGIISQLLHICLRSGLYETVESLIAQGADPFFTNTLGETALYVAARTGHTPSVVAILDSPSFLESKVDLVEKQNGWSPLLVASVHGDSMIAMRLQGAGANIWLKDHRGWNAAEHAAFRGHLSLAAWLKTFAQDRRVRDTGERGLGFTLPPRRPAFDSAIAILKPSIKPKTMKRPYYTESHGKSYIFIKMGPVNTRIESRAVEFCSRTLNPADLSNPEIAYILRIEAVGMNGHHKYFQLPILSDLANDPIVFETSDVSKAKVLFSLLRVENMVTKQGTAVGAGAAVLQSLTQGLAQDFESLVRDYSVPVLATDMSEVLATVTFNYLLSTPVQRRPVSDVAKKGFWKDEGKTQVVGHRGSGSNTILRTNLQLGENTVQSLTTAVDLGATGVEFDVQLTKDLVPVIYHDFTVMQQGGDTPIHALQADQFSYLSKTDVSRGDLSTMVETKYNERSLASPRPRSRSLALYDDSQTLNIHARMRTTAEGKKGHIKGNVRGLAIQDAFPTFKELLTKVPESVAFDVEMKYPMLWEAEDRDMLPVCVEANAFVDRVLETIYLYGGNRSIGFSSFSPEMCILLATKQSDYPILFLSKAGSVPVGDVRSASLQQSIHFAKRWGLAGIVMLSDPFVRCPSLIGYAKSAGLTQAQAGLDVIIVNKVRRIAETLAASKDEGS
ncbi:MAG: Glycerophosphocholine phosphodiesterase [Bogoriella megaspora]|nr:MAG: Glycerophosphocholine phosphodiesterase [Bogoriella megaspora]